MRVPAHLWAAIQRFSAWIEPAIVAEWIRVTQRYGAKQGRSLDEARLAAAMTWSDPSRDVRVPRERAEQLLAARRLYCVWSGKRLTAANLDIDHCFPWTVWPCGDLWNLMPAHRKVNQHEKRDRLPADPLLRTAQERILDWWNAAYREQSGPSAGAALRTGSVGEPAWRRRGGRGSRRLLLRPEPAAPAAEAEPAGSGMERHALLVTSA